MNRKLLITASAFLVGCWIPADETFAAESSNSTTNTEFAQLLKSPGSNSSELVVQFDVDGDGVLNKAERTAARRFLREAAVAAVLKSFDSKDGDHDGKLSSDEAGGGRRNPLVVRIPMVMGLWTGKRPPSLRFGRTDPRWLWGAIPTRKR